MKNPWTKTGLRVRDGEGDRCSRASTAYIIPAYAVAQRLRGGDGQAWVVPPPGLTTTPT
jgi:hypothetical protein